MIKITKTDFRPAVAFSVILIMLLIPTVKIAGIVQSKSYGQAAITQSKYTVKIGTARGTIYDRNMQRITNENVFYMGTAAYDPSLQSLYKAINETSAEPQNVLNLLQNGKPVVFESICEHYSDGVLSFPVYKRYSELGAHLIGYPTSSAKYGYTGIEGAYNSILNKYTGEISVSYTVDAGGRGLNGIKPVISDTMSKANGGIMLTVDKNLQLFCAKLLENKRGSIIVTEKNGDILACVSSPTFNPNDIANALDADGSPLFNRSFSAYDVGSVFKTVVTAAALENGIDTERSYECKGYIDVNGVIIRCHRHSGHGVMNLRTALVNSCNPYFIDLALSLGAEKITEMAYKLGFGKEIILAEGVKSKSGNLPSLKDLSSPAAVANLAIGQGSLLATPLQINTAINCFANNGKYILPRLVIGEIDEQGTLIDTFGRDNGKAVMSEQTAKTVLNNMSAVFAEGSLSKYKPEKFTAAGKTSTAQTGIIADDGHNVCQTWVAGIYPAEFPQYTVTVFIEDGASGASSCGPIFKSVCNYISNAFL